ncbi:hypothetical protein [Roseibium album]|uniref:hypothetical protein n=1 Tax=Roseibium album TaxID=311410 RepID=UPI003299ABBB
MMNLTFTAPRTAEEALAFAFENMDSNFEIADFLRDFHEGQPLDGWMKILAEGVMDAMDIYEEQHKLEIAVRKMQDDKEREAVEAQRLSSRALHGTVETSEHQ